MFGYFSPSNWFWIFIAILISCYVKLAASRGVINTPMPSFSPASIVSLLK